MAEPRRLYDVVTEETDVAASQPGHDTATSMLLLALQALSKRAVIALESCFTLVTVALVFWISFPILSGVPTINQLAGLCTFSVFVLIANWLVLKRRA